MTSDTYSAVIETREDFDRCLASLLGQEHGSFCAVLLVGMDRFKSLNEFLGQAFGDQVLQLVSQRLQSALREQDTIFRLAGDEFAVLLNPVLSGPDATGIAERLSALLQRAYLVRGQIVDTSASFGIAMAPLSGTDSETLLKRARIALRHAKSCGAGMVQLFEAAWEDGMVARHALTLDLRKALLLRQLEVYYQPQVNIGGRELSGFEALLRWRHPELGWISPAEFIPLAEQAGLIGMIGEWVLRTACQQAALLPDHIVIAVNASPLQLKVETFASVVERALSIASIPAPRLEIEVTEGVLLQGGGAGALDELHAMGVRLAMDDFGTGYSSLSQLAKLPFDTIKIDRSLVGGSSKQRAIVRAVATLGQGLGISTLIEGIETEEEFTDARSDGCMFAQGYLFGKAVPAGELDDVLRRLPPTSHSSSPGAPCV